MNFKRQAFKNVVIAFVIIAILAISAVPTHAALGDRLLRRGSRGNDVKVLQEKLNQSGHNSGKADGIFGGLTYNAVISYQRSKNLSVDGIVGPQTIRAINNNQSSKPKPSTPNRGNSPSKPANPGSLSSSRLLRQGSRGNDVQALQERLNALGHSAGRADGIFGRLTYNAVVSYQRSQGLSTDGIVGPQTINAINNNPASKPKPSTPDRGGGSKDIKTDLVNTAKKYLGTPYVYGGSSTSGFDCSGFTQFVYRQLAISIPRTSGTQASAGVQISKSNLQVGDLVIFANRANTAVGHTGIYIGGNQFIHCSTSKGVIISNMATKYYSDRFYYGRRVY